MKTCTKCHVHKPLEGFYKRKDRKNGYKSHCKKCFTKNIKKRYQNNSSVRQRRNTISKNWNKNNLDRILKKHHLKMKTDPIYKVKYRLRQNSDKRRFRTRKIATTGELIGCTWGYLKQWIESQMTDTMAFDTIHIDHMMPLKSFDLTKPEEQRKACHYTNLQPMLPSENLSKGSKIVHDMRWNGQQWEINRSGIYELRDKNIK